MHIYNTGLHTRRKGGRQEEYKRAPPQLPRLPGGSSVYTSPCLSYQTQYTGKCRLKGLRERLFEKTDPGGVGAGVQLGGWGAV